MTMDNVNTSVLMMMGHIIAFVKRALLYQITT